LAETPRWEFPLVGAIQDGVFWPWGANADPVGFDVGRYKILADWGELELEDWIEGGGRRQWLERVQPTDLDAAEYARQAGVGDVCAWMHPIGVIFPCRAHEADFLAERLWLMCSGRWPGPPHEWLWLDGLVATDVPNKRQLDVMCSTSARNTVS
jgi:hypothetical protein